MKTNLKYWFRKNIDEVFKNQWFSVTKSNYIIPETKEEAVFYLIHQNDGVITIPTTKDNKIVLVKQFRPALGKVFYDFPGGGCEAGDTHPLERAKKELLEETGYGNGVWKPLGTVVPSPGRSASRSHIFYARNVKKINDQKLDATESIEIELVTKEELVELIKKNEFECATCVAALYKTELLDNK